MTPATTTRAGSAAALTTDKLLRMYRQMLTIRLFEERVNDLYTRALMPGLAHLYIGEEAVAVGICEALRPDDYITSTYRGHHRTKAEELHWTAERDPLKLFSEWLLGENLVDRSALDRIEQTLVGDMDAAVDFAVKAPYPDPDKVEQDVYA